MVLDKELLIKVEHPNVVLQLKSEDGLIDEEKWEDENDMSTKLLLAIDKILTRNKIEIQELTEIQVKSDQQSYTSTRIAKTVAKTVNYCLGS